uniref:Uncharacterized protein n=1 Tax=Romanomermis culicivorax TaxID=13658 RepID=A0A915L6T2_ROMCU
MPNILCLEFMDSFDKRYNAEKSTPRNAQNFVLLLIGQTEPTYFANFVFRLRFEREMAINALYNVQTNGRFVDFPFKI